MNKFFVFGGSGRVARNLIKDLVIDGYQKEVLTLNQLDEGMIDDIKIKYVIDWLLENGQFPIRFAFPLIKKQAIAATSALITNPKNALE